MAVISIK